MEWPIICRYSNNVSETTCRGPLEGVSSVSLYLIRSDELEIIYPVQGRRGQNHTLSSGMSPNRPYGRIRPHPRFICSGIHARTPGREYRVPFSNCFFEIYLTFLVPQLLPFKVMFCLFFTISTFIEIGIAIENYYLKFPSNI